MDPSSLDPTLVDLATSLIKVTANNTVGYVTGKISEAKTKKDLEQQNIVYTELINGLLVDKQDLERIALEYKSLYESITISDDDIEYLQNTLTKISEIMRDFMPVSEETEASLKLVISLLNKDTLKTMQLIGFNYKEAIGHPLTEATSHLIKKKLGTLEDGRKKKK